MTTPQTGAQRLSLAQLQQWEALRYGMFIHFGMSTFDGEELSTGTAPSTLYAPDQLDVAQWVAVARDAGMKYAVLTTKHVAGHCLWPSKHTDYHVGTSGNPTDVVEKFVEACARCGVKPGFYYCSWDNHHRFGTQATPSDIRALVGQAKTDECDPLFHTLYQAYTTRGYWDFQLAQLEELLTGYGAIAEVWIDIPAVLPRTIRTEQYEHISRWQPDAVIMMNHGIGDGSIFKIAHTWPTDLIAIERYLPNSTTGHVKWRDVEGRKYYMPGEVCEPIGREWFYTDSDQPRSDAELLGMYLATTSRGANLLLDVGPDRHGLIPQRYTDALMRLRRNLDKLGM